MKKNIVIIAIMLIIFALTACSYPSSYKWKMYKQPNTKWLSDDETIVLYVNDSLSITGTLDVNGDLVEIYVTEDPGRGIAMDIYPIDVLKCEVISENDKYEYWVCSYESENKFIATVKETTFYEVGQTFTFYKTN